MGSCCTYAWFKGYNLMAWLNYVILKIFEKIAELIKIYFFKQIEIIKSSHQSFFSHFSLIFTFYLFLFLKTFRPGKFTLENFNTFYRQYFIGLMLTIRMIHVMKKNKASSWFKVRWILSMKLYVLFANY